MAQKPVTECRWCGLAHGVDIDDPVICPYVKALEFAIDLNGKEIVSRVEFLTPADFGKVEREQPEQPEYRRKGPQT